MLNRRNIVIVIIALVVIIIGIILLLTLGHKKVTPVAVKKEIPLITNNKAQKNGQQVQVVSSTPPTADQVAQFDAMQLASNFAERFGTFSNQSAMQNLKDAEVFMTATMRAWADSSIAAAAKVKNNISAYQGTITKAVSADTVSATAAGAEVLVHCQRKTDKQVVYQDLEVKLVKSGTSWLVDKAVWQK